MKHDALGYWIEEAGEREPGLALAADREADVVVVGAGYTGMWAAWHLKQLEPECRVVVLEAGLVGHGPSGRNGGFCNTMWFSLPRMRERFGDGPALEIARAAERSVDEIGGFCERHGIDAWFRKAGYMQVSTTEAHDNVTAETARACRELGVPEAVRELSPAQVAERCRSPWFRGGVFYPGTATVQPARLANGLLEQLRASGIEVFERSPVTRLRRAGGGGVEARTPGGDVRAGSALIAAGCAVAGRRWQARGRLTIASSHIVLTEPVPELLDQVGWTGGECITDSRALVHYFRTTPDGRIAFGWGGGRIGFGARLDGRVELDPEVVEQAGKDLSAIFPGLEGKRVERAWGGPIDASPAHLPTVMVDGAGSAGVVATAFGYTGNGVGPAQVVGRAMASLALDRRDEASRLAFVDPSPPRVPPEPLRWLGGTAIRAALLRTERAELTGRRPGVVSRTIAAIPHRIGFHIGR